MVRIGCGPEAIAFEHSLTAPRAFTCVVRSYTIAYAYTTAPLAVDLEHGGQFDVAEPVGVLDLVITSKSALFVKAIRTPAIVENVAAFRHDPVVRIPLFPDGQIAVSGVFHPDVGQPGVTPVAVLFKVDVPLPSHERGKIVVHSGFGFKADARQRIGNVRGRVFPVTVGHPGPEPAVERYHGRFFIPFRQFNGLDDFDDFLKLFPILLQLLPFPLGLPQLQFQL